MPYQGFEPGTFGAAAGFHSHYTTWSAYKIVSRNYHTLLKKGEGLFEKRHKVSYIRFLQRTLLENIIKTEFFYKTVSRNNRTL